MAREPSFPRGRGSGSNPAGRFERLEIELDEDAEEARPQRVATQFLRDGSRSIIATNDSPDLFFEASLNPYRGCEHGCAYCYARPTHEYLGFSPGLDFESRILIKEDAPELLRRELSSPRWQPKVLAMSGVTDAYQPVEARLGLSRRCLEVLVEHRSPVLIVTKNRLVARDADLLAQLARHEAAAVFLSIGSLDGDLVRRMEPRTSHPRRRLEAIETLAAAGVPAGVLVAPLVPALNDHEIPQVLAAAAAAGASFARYTLLRLPGAVAGLFQQWLEENYPDRKEKVLSRQRSLRGGKINEARFHHRFHGQGVFAQQIRQLFEGGCRRHGLAIGPPPLSTAAFRRQSAQMELFG